MYNREKRVLLREYLEQGWSKTALAQKFGISRRTICLFGRYRLPDQ